VSAHDDLPAPVLKPGALYWSDNGRLVCSQCAGFTARYTGHDISGQKVARVTIGDVEVWLADRDEMSCEMGCTTLTDVAGPDGWPLPKGGGSDGA